MEKLSVAMIGAGGRGMSHANAMAAAPNIEFVAVCDILEEAGKGTSNMLVFTLKI